MLVYDQSCLVHPFSESRGGVEVWHTYIHRQHWTFFQNLKILDTLDITIILLKFLHKSQPTCHTRSVMCEESLLLWQNFHLLWPRVIKRAVMESLNNLQNGIALPLNKISNILVSCLLNPAGSNTKKHTWFWKLG